MTGDPSSTLPRRDAVAFQPAARFGENVLSRGLDPPVEECQAAGGEPRRDGVHGVEEASSVAPDRCRADHRYDILGGLQPAVIRERDQVAGCQVPVGGKQHRDVRHTVLERGDALPFGFERQEPGEAQTVHGPQPWHAIRAGRALWRAAQSHPPGDPGQVAYLAQAQTTGGGMGDDEAVLVLSPGWRQDPYVPAGKQPGQFTPHRRRIGHRNSGSRLEAGQRASEVLGDQVDQALFQRWLDDLARTEIELQANRDPRILDGQSVDRRQQFALGEVKRRHHHSVPSRAPGMLHCPGGRLARRERGNEKRIGEYCCHPGPEYAPHGHGVTFFAPPRCRPQRSPARSMVVRP